MKESAVSVVTLIMTMLLLPVQVAADVGLAWVQPTPRRVRGARCRRQCLHGGLRAGARCRDEPDQARPNGTRLWVASFDQTSTTAWERASWVATDSAGNAIVCGTLMSGYSNPVEAASIVMKFDRTGRWPGGVSMKPASMARRCANASSTVATMFMCSAWAAAPMVG